MIRRVISAIFELSVVWKYVGTMGAAVCEVSIPQSDRPRAHAMILNMARTTFHSSTVQKSTIHLFGNAERDTAKQNCH